MSEEVVKATKKL